MNICKNYSEITTAQASEFARELLEISATDEREIVLDFANVENICSVAMSSLFATYQTFLEQQRSLWIANPNDQVRRLLFLVNMGGIIVDDHAREIVLASGNRGKIAELTAMLSPLGLSVRSPADFPGWPEIEETGKTFAENATLKAEAGCAFTGCATVADDSGLVVDCLDGAPGIFSARFSGADATPEKNNALLLKKMENVPAEQRTARFVCALAYKKPGMAVKIFTGETAGRILDAPRGTGGFGYDPLFFSTDLQCGFAEVGGEAKNRVSHRGRALAQLKEFLQPKGE